MPTPAYTRMRYLARDRERAAHFGARKSPIISSIVPHGRGHGGKQGLLLSQNTIRNSQSLFAFTVTYEHCMLESVRISRLWSLRHALQRDTQIVHCGISRPHRRNIHHQISYCVQPLPCADHGHVPRRRSPALPLRAWPWSDSVLLAELHSVEACAPHATRAHGPRDAAGVWPPGRP